MARVASHLGSILRQRKKIQALRKVPDRELMGSGDIFVYSDDMSSSILTMGYSFINSFLNGYWHLIKKLI